MRTSWFRRWLAHTGRPTAPVFRLQLQPLEDRTVPYNLGSRWTSTVTSPGPLVQGDPTIIRWSFVPDGVNVPAGSGEAASNNVLIATLDARFGAGPGGSDLTQRPWFHIFTDSYDRLGAISGLTYVYEPKDDGAALFGSPGVLGVRGDARVSGHPIDGASGILAYDFFPNGSDMVIDTDDMQAGGFFTDPSNNFLALRDVYMHENGHGVGLQHEMPVDGVALMEPFVNTSFDGPQIDDIQALQRHYGDVYEKNGGNDTIARATPLGAISANGTATIGADTSNTSQRVLPTQTDFVSIDGSSDTDVYSFTLIAGTQVDLALAPRGPTYLSGVQGGPAPTSFNASAQSDLKLELLDSTGNVLQSANATGLGGSESTPGLITLGGGTYYARVTGTQNALQMYRLTVNSTLVRVVPTITRDPAQPPATNAWPVRFDVHFTYPVTGFTNSDIQFLSGSIGTGLSATVTPNGVTGDSYFVDVSGGSAVGTVGIDIPDSAAVGSTLGLPTTAASTPAGELVSFDNVAPVPTFTPATIGLTRFASTPMTLTFSEPVNSFTSSALQTVNANVQGFTRTGPNTFTFSLVANGDGAFSVTIPAGATTDMFGNPNTAATVAGTLDATPPTATVTRVSAPAIRIAPAVFRVTFSEPIAAGSFTPGDVSLTGSTVGGTMFTAVAPDTTLGAPANSFLVTITGMNGTGTVAVSLANGAATDVAGNGSGAATAATLLFDNVAPTIGFTPTSPLLTNRTSIPITLTFSEPVVNFTQAGIQVGGAATLGSVVPAGDGVTFTATLNRTTDGPFTLTLLAGAAADPVGNPSTSTALTGVFDMTAPTVVVTRESAPVTRSGPAVFRVTFSEPVAAGSLTPAGVSFAGSSVGGTLAATVAPDTAPGAPANSFLVNVTGMTGVGTVQVALIAGAAADPAGNPSVAATADAPITYDDVAPTVALSTPAGAVTNAPTVAVTVTFSEPILNFTSASLRTTGQARITGFAPTGDGRSFVVTLTRAADGSFGLTVPAGAAVDPAGNLSTTATLGGAFDTTAPTITVAPTAVGFTDVPVTFTMTFSEPPGDPAAVLGASVTVGGNARPVAATVSATADPKVFVVTVIGMHRSGTVTVQVPGGVTDTAGNPSKTPSATSASYTSTAPPPVELVGSREFAVGADAGGTGNVQFFNPDGSLRYETSAFGEPITTGVRTAAADFTGDGIADLVIGTGPGVPTVVRILDGATGRQLARVAPFEASFTGGVFVAAGDLTGDGQADLVVTADQGGGPRVLVFRGGDFTRVADFLGIEDRAFRGGTRAAIGDMNGDGRADLLVAAGSGGGPRVAGYDGTTLGTRTPTHLFADFFVFERGLRDGVYLAAGDVDGDGFADLVAGGGPGGAPRVLVLNGADLMARKGVAAGVISNFYAGDPESRGGARVAVKNLDNDPYADVVTGGGTGNMVTAHLGQGLTLGADQVDFQFPAYYLFDGGIFVG